jgi:hypothetical protein
MRRLAFSALVYTFSVGLFLALPQPAGAQKKAPPGGAYKQVSTLVALPDFVPGLGTLYVDPATLPTGPFLAYDHQGKLVSSIYMVPIADMDAHKAFSALKIAEERPDHVDIVFNAGHPGMAMPHYHFIVWYVSKEDAAKLAQ